MSVMDSNSPTESVMTAGGADQQLASLNMAAALERVAGDIELLREVARLFLEAAPELMAEIMAAVESQDASALERAAHSLKGSIGTFGAEHAWKAAYHVECLGRKGDLREAGAAVNSLQRALKQLEQDLQTLSL